MNNAKQVKGKVTMAKLSLIARLTAISELLTKEFSDASPAAIMSGGVLESVTT